MPFPSTAPRVPARPGLTANPSPRIPGFDRSHWLHIQAISATEGWQAVQGHVLRTSTGRPWRGLTVWHQVGPVGDLYVPPTPCHSILIRRGTSSELLQRHGDLTYTGELAPGEAIILPANTPSFWRSNATRDYIHIDLEPIWLERAGGQSVRLSSCFGQHDPILAALAQALVASLDNNVSLSASFGDNLALSIALHLLENYAEPDHSAREPASLSQRQARLLADVVGDNLGERWQVADMAELVGLSPFHFARAFKATFGIAPHAYVQQRRMEVAAQLLRDTHRPIADIARSVGHSSVSHFTQSFRHHWGVPPNAYRRRT